MLPPFIIEHIRQREENLRQQEQPVLELPLEEAPGISPASPRGQGAPKDGMTEPGFPAHPSGDEAERGVVILQM
jgi:hypothetical protein